MNFEFCQKCINPDEIIVTQDGNEVTVNLHNTGTFKKCSISGKLPYKRNLRKRILLYGSIAVCEYSNQNGSFDKFTISRKRDIAKMLSRLGVSMDCKYFVEQTVKDLYK